MLREQEINRGHGLAEHRVDAMRRQREEDAMNRERTMEENYVEGLIKQTRNTLLNQMEVDIARQLERQKVSFVV